MTMTTIVLGLSHAQVVTQYPGNCLPGLLHMDLKTGSTSDVHSPTRLTPDTAVSTANAGLLPGTMGSAAALTQLL